MSYKQVFPNQEEIAAAKKIVTEQFGVGLTSSEFVIDKVMQSEAKIGADEYEVQISFTGTFTLNKAMRKREPWWAEID
jgi:hypothetical protein